MTHGCDQTAFYGTVFNMPRWCKAHMSAGTGSVRKRCAMFDCSNAVFTNTLECERCARVVAAIENFRRKSLDELKYAIDKENVSRVDPVTVATKETVVPAARTASAPAMSRLASSKTTTVNQNFGPGQSRRPMESPDQNMLKTVASKIVRIPDEVSKPNDLAIAKKRTQTPGRVRGLQSQNE